MTGLDANNNRQSDSQTALQRNKIFEKVALDRLRSDESTRKPVSFLPLPVRLVAFMAASVTGLGTIWAFIAKVPIHAYGVASISPEIQVSSSIAHVSGTLSYQVSGISSQTSDKQNEQINRELSEFWDAAVVNNSPTKDFKLLNRLALGAMSPLRGQVLIMPESADRDTIPIDDLDANSASYRSIYYPANTIIARIGNASKMERLDAERRLTLPKLLINENKAKGIRDRLEQYEQMSSLLTQQWRSQQQELRERQLLYQKLYSLWSEGSISKSQLLQEEAAMNGLKTQILQTKRDQVNNQFNKSDQIGLGRQSSLDTLTTRNNLQASLVEYLSDTYIISPPSGFYIVSKIKRNGMFVDAGDEILTYSTEKPVLPRTVPVFVDATTSQQLSEGMRVMLTPRGISRAQYGGIPGTITEVGKLPLLDEGVESYAGGRSLARVVTTQTGTSTYLVMVRLTQSDPSYCQQMLSRRCYKWSTNRVPPYAVRLGTLADVQIDVDYRHPVDFIMPFLRQSLGLVVDNK